MSMMTSSRRKIYEMDAATINFYRNNPCIACEDLLGIQLSDVQNYILQNSWNATQSVWCCCRNFGKSFLGAVFMILKALLYENQAIYIVSSVGNQSKETFQKIEEIVLRIGKTSASIRSLKDIVEKETVRNTANKSGFSHNPENYKVKFYNGSEIITLNGNPDRNRSRRASLVFFDEAAFSSDELIAICEAFATQSTDFITDINEDYNPELESKKVPTQLIYASSQSEMDKIFYTHYKNFAKNMLAGDKRYFVCDMICDIPMNVIMKGKKYPPLLTQEKVDDALKANKEKALREYYNKPTQDGGNSQIVKWDTVRRNENFYLPQLVWKPNSKIVLAFDPARTGDNSIMTAMNIYQDEELGWCGDFINCVNMIDVATKQKYKLDSNRQIEQLRKWLIKYNGQNPDYEYIDSLLIDAGSGGGGKSTYADFLLNDWQDRAGKTHRGLIDKSHDLYTTYGRMYPNAVNKLRLIEPRKYRTQMVEEFIELMDLGVIKFPYDYKGQDYIRIPNGVNKKTHEEQFTDYQLSDDEKLSLIQLDLLKQEITSIHKTTNPEKTSVNYALAKDKANKMHDDRFYTAILLAHRLYEIRRGSIVNKKPANTGRTYFMCRKPKSYKN